MKKLHMVSFLCLIFLLFNVVCVDPVWSGIDDLKEYFVGAETGTVLSPTGVSSQRYNMFNYVDESGSTRYTFWLCLDEGTSCTINQQTNILEGCDYGCMFKGNIPNAQGQTNKNHPYN
ncbi:MAG: hypothetical protein HQL21_02950 [Candidatus Omnitrophica bacterium]|nr:hypothetical protein [Candidatus Omnitrophota bacterium]